MVLRSLIDDGVVPASRVLLAGARSWDPGEEAFAAEAGVRAFGVDELAGLLDPEPFGMPAGDLVAAIKALTARLPLSGGTIAAYAPGSEQAKVDDAPTLLRIVGALAAKKK